MRESLEEVLLARGSGLLGKGSPVTSIPPGPHLAPQSTVPSLCSSPSGARGQPGLLWPQHGRVAPESGLRLRGGQLPLLEACAGAAHPTLHTPPAHSL